MAVLTGRRGQLDWQVVMISEHKETLTMTNCEWFGLSSFLTLHIRLSKSVLDAGVWIVHTGFRIPCQGKLDSGSLELIPGFQGQEFWISQLKISQIPESVLPFMERFVAF